MRDQDSHDGSHSGKKSPSAVVVGVHSLGQFIFCGRAGQIAHETSDDDSGTDDIAPRLDYLPNYDLRRITEELKQVTEALKVAALWAVPVSLIWLIVLWFDLATAGIIAGCIAVFLGPKLWALVRAFVFLHWRSYRYRTAPALDIDFKAPIQQSVNWWQLIKFGFDSIEPKVAYRDAELGLKGKPFRILQRGALRIPVILARGKAQVRRKHRIRLAAYAHLIEVCESGQVPFGVVLFAGTDEAVTVPITPMLRAEFKKELFALQQQIVAVAAGRSIPPAPNNESLCRNCPFARPRRYRRGKSESVFAGVKAAPYGFHIGNGPMMHCDCGDRFRWCPPA